MKAVMISIQPKWVEKICCGKKTIEVRNTKPKIDTPFKCYIYCTKGSKNENVLLVEQGGESVCFGDYRNAGRDMNGNVDCHIGNGKVIGEFVCDEVYNLVQAGVGIMFATENLDLLEPQMFRDMSCLTDEQVSDYLGNKDGYAWHISDLVVYDEPKELSEFWEYNAELNKLFNEGEDYCAWGRCETESGCTNDCDTENVLHCYQCWEEWNSWCRRIIRPPQSWCYVEEKE